MPGTRLPTRVKTERAGQQATRFRGLSQPMSWEQGDLSGLPTVIDFDAGSLVLTTFGRSDAWTVRGDQEIADRYLNLFFRI